jgi:hypothetical protein
MAATGRTLRRFHWWDGALWWYSYSVGGFEGYRTPGGRRLPCATMAEALRDPSRRDEIRRLASRPRERFKPILVVAGSRAQFRKWCRDTGHHERRDAVYVSSERVLRGRQGGTYVITGTGLERRDIAEIERSLRIVGAEPMAE